MIENIATRMVRKMQKEKLLDSQMEEHNVYALITLTEKWLTIITIMIIALFLGKIVPTLFFCFFSFHYERERGDIMLRNSGYAISKVIYHI